MQKGQGGLEKIRGDCLVTQIGSKSHRGSPPSDEFQKSNLSELSESVSQGLKQTNV